ncbi:heavy metal-associated domain-containing protein [Hahella sp. SMD15-11]|uniref:Heavy metal-associated domain-containing protein n=1 Tax=Thermohahella caldifontis TaxID=3142973 RepID=A0AB39UT92_9GAMM
MSKTYHFRITEVGCQACIDKITKALKAHPNITDVKVDKASERLFVTGDNLDSDAIAKEVTDLGYPTEYLQDIGE